MTRDPKMYQFTKKFMTYYANYFIISTYGRNHHVKGLFNSIPNVNNFEKFIQHSSMWNYIKHNLPESTPALEYARANSIKGVPAFNYFSDMRETYNLYYRCIKVFCKYHHADYYRIKYSNISTPLQLYQTVRNAYSKLEGVAMEINSPFTPVTVNSKEHKWFVHEATYDYYKDLELLVFSATFLKTGNFNQYCLYALPALVRVNSTRDTKADEDKAKLTISDVCQYYYQYTIEIKQFMAHHEIYLANLAYNLYEDVNSLSKYLHKMINDFNLFSDVSTQNNKQKKLKIKIFNQCVVKLNKLFNHNSPYLWLVYTDHFVLYNVGSCNKGDIDISFGALTSFIDSYCQSALKLKKYYHKYILKMPYLYNQHYLKYVDNEQLLRVINNNKDKSGIPLSHSKHRSPINTKEKSKQSKRIALAKKLLKIEEQYPKLHKTENQILNQLKK